MVHNLVHNLCESLVTNIGDIVDTGKRTPPVPITHLTQWQMMGNSVVHTDEYLTQWKVEGNSVVDNNAILSCGDLGQDGKYHVKISNGVTIYDIPLTEPLRKVNDITDTIEFVNGVATLTRNIAATKIRDNTWRMGGNIETDNYGFYFEAENKKRSFNLMCGGYNTLDSSFAWTSPDMSIGATATNDRISLKDLRYFTVAEFLQGQGDNVIIYELDTPTTETIQVAPFPISPTDTYTSANDTPYSAFEYKKNVEIWSCGEYNPIDGKWHIRILPEGYGIVDIALDEPLRKVNDVADSIEFADGVTTVTRNIGSVNMGDYTYELRNDLATSVFVTTISDKATGLKNLLSALYTTSNATSARNLNDMEIIGNANFSPVYLRDMRYSDAVSLKAALNGVKLIYELATPTTETIQVPQIQEAESYSCVISQGAKAVEWSSFETN